MDIIPYTETALMDEPMSGVCLTPVSHEPLDMQFFFCLRKEFRPICCISCDNDYASHYETVGSYSRAICIITGNCGNCGNSRTQSLCVTATTTSFQGYDIFQVTSIYRKIPLVYRGPSVCQARRCSSGKVYTRFITICRPQCTTRL